MATLFLLCGLPCSGKTTLALELERERPALRLCPDEWMSRIVGDGYDHERREAVDQIQMEIAVRALELGIDAVFESGGWSRADRDKQRAMAGAVPGARVELIYFDVSHDELRRRLAARNAALPPDTFAVEHDLFDQMITWFEAPTAAENPLAAPEAATAANATPGTSPTAFMLPGLPGAGKTTLAKQIERERPALRLCPDDWMERIVRDLADHERRRAVEDVQLDIAVRALALGVEIVFEQAGWKRSERDRQRALVAGAPGARFDLIWLDAPREVLWRRFEARNAAALQAGAHVMSSEVFTWLLGQFEPPSPDEGAERRS